GELTLEDADERVRQVARACADAERETGGLFSARWRGGFDPTGYVKGWAAEHAARRWLGPLVHRTGVRAAGLNVGGDMQLFTAPGEERPWRIGI
ncbi:hypothetical protein, partial [Parvimonas sp. M13]|uniref:hypothetical protein n=1 Tax=Parvimonas sp. M13 TaxID=3110694 RepID=UPI002B4781D0